MATKGIVERMDVRPDNLHYREHVARYELALQFITRGPVLDIASGTGYGSELIQTTTQSMVVGLDVDQPSVAIARRDYTNPKISFLVGTGATLPFTSEAFAAITSMETLEHVEDDRGFLHELARVLQPGGVCIVTTPNRLYSLDHGITNPYHIREYSESELTELLSGVFDEVKVFYQGFQDSYHETVKDYSVAIQEQKKHLGSGMRWAIDHVYRPLKSLVPTGIANFFIRRWFGLSYPQPSLSEITISSQTVRDCSNFVVLCRKHTRST